MENTDKNRKKRWLLLVLLLLLLLLLLGVLFCRKKPQTTDTAPAPESSVSTSDGGGTVSLTYSDAAGIDFCFDLPEPSAYRPGNLRKAFAFRLIAHHGAKKRFFFHAHFQHGRRL